MNRNLFSLIIIGVICPLILWYVNISQHPKPTQTPSSSNAAVVTPSSLPPHRPPILPNELKSFNDVQNVPDGTFNYGGSTTWASIRKQLDPEITRSLNSRFKLRYRDPIKGDPGSEPGIQMLLRGELDFSQSSRDDIVEKYEQQANNKGFSLQMIPVAIDGIAITVHPKLQVPGLTVPQLKEIYQGNLTNWNQIINGLDLPIIPYSRKLEESGTVQFFKEIVLDNKDFGSKIEYVSETTPALRKVATNLGSIYYASAPELVSQCTVKTLPIGRDPKTIRHDDSKKLVPPYLEPFVPLDQCPKRRNNVNSEVFKNNDYPLTRTLSVIVKVKKGGGIYQKAGEAYANFLKTQQGQEMLEKAGFVRFY